MQFVLHIWSHIFEGEKRRRKGRKTGWDRWCHNLDSPLIFASLPNDHTWLQGGWRKKWANKWSHDDDKWCTVFAGWLTYEQPEVVFPEKIIARGPHHRQSPTRRGGNWSQIGETDIRSATTTPQCHLLSGTPIIFW